MLRKLILILIAGLTIAGIGFMAWPRESEFRAVARKLREGHNEIYGRAQIADLRRDLAAANGDLTREIEVRTKLAKELARVGELPEAAEHVDAALTLCRGSREKPTTSPLEAQVLEMRGIVYLRMAEVENCITRHNAQCCIFPLQDDGVHSQRAPIERAQRSFSELLSLQPANLKARWLLNIAHMACGDYPQGVAAEHLIPPTAFASEVEFPRFRDVLPELKLNTMSLAGGAIVEDMTGDGLLDIVVSTCDPEQSLQFFRNLGNGQFEEFTDRAGAQDQLGGLNCVAADYDNDGDMDILVLRGAWLYDDGQMRNSLLRNDNGVFTDVSQAAGVGGTRRPTQVGVWADFDNDGDLDLWVGNESRAELVPRGTSYPSEYYRNNGNGTFTEMAAAAGLINDRYCKGASAGDYDNDGDMDLYVSNIGPHRLYRNNGDGTFTDVAPQLNVTAPVGRSFAPWFFDYDNDGWLDIWAPSYDTKIEDIVNDALGKPYAATNPRLYHNNGNGTFTDVAGAMGLHHPWLPMGANFGDLDNDGWLDFYLGTGDPEFASLMPNIMLKNDAGRRFLNVTTAGGFGHLQKGHGTAFADLDEDGDQDIYHQMGAFFPADGFHDVLFENPGNKNHFLTIVLRGEKTNRFGYGARIKVEVDTTGGPQAFHRAVGSVSSFGGSPARQEIGLGQATGIRLVSIWWPRSGERQEFKDVPLDSKILITEGKPQFQVLPMKSFQLGASPPVAAGIP